MALTSRLFILRHHPSFPDPEIAPERDALNCVRVLTRILPFIYEADNLAAWEERFFWGARRKRTRQSAIAAEVLFDGAQEGQKPPKNENADFEDAKPLAEELIDTLVDLLFFSDLTLPRQPSGRPKVSYAIWQSGVGCNTSVATTKEFESNRSEILRLLLTMTSQSMYMSSNVLPQRGIRALTHICTCPDKQVVLSVLCSLLNTVCEAARSLSLGCMLTDADPQVQSSYLACTIQYPGLQGREADTGDIHTPAFASVPVVPNPRAKRHDFQELLPPFPWQTPSATRLSVHRRRHDTDSQPAAP